MQTQVPQAGTSSTSLDDSTTVTLNSLNGRLKVSAKIQQATQHAEAAQASDAAGISRR
jgi:hypothetical protein